MADYKKMYAILCGAIDDIIDPLQQIPAAVPYAQQLRSALLETEEIYLRTDGIESIHLERNCSRTF